METPIAFVAEGAGSGIEIVVNFGVMAGREATPAEVDRLARTLLHDVDPLAIVAARRHEYGHGSETVVHQVVVQVAVAEEQTADRLRGACEAWALDCAAERRLDMLDL